MLLVKTSVRPSAIHGLGVFAEQSIPGGETIWKFLPGFDQIFPKAVLLDVPEVVREYVDHYCYCGDLVLFTGDHDHFINHSDDPNMLFDPIAMTGIALRDIEIGEEITESYLNNRTWNKYASTTNEDRKMTVHCMNAVRSPAQDKDPMADARCQHEADRSQAPLDRTE